jgi:S-adenosylmethionine:tRNA ribosyltransferase-isomerase
MKISDFDFQLPDELIAHVPIEPRDHSRLMIVDRKRNQIIHDYFYNLTKYLSPDDLVVFNETKVIPARLYGHKETGGKIEVLLLPENDQWKFISRPGIKTGHKILFSDDLSADVQNEHLIFNKNYIEVLGLLNSIGHTPLPPYINFDSGKSEANIRRRYQTVYAKNSGSVAAPTAGFHFTNEILNQLPNKAFVTLHVGLGTFLPVKTEIIEEHHMHTERFYISSEAKNQVIAAKRVIAVGTTSARVLESNWESEETNIFIYPGYEFKHLGGLITNFHLPKSTLLMLVSAFAGRELTMRAYQEAVENKYRFYSFGDAMFII